MESLPAYCKQPFKRWARWTAACLAAASLAACVAAPVDLRTGQPIVWPGVVPARDGPLFVPVPVTPPPAVVYTARLYPINQIASRAGMLTAVVTDGHAGRGNITLSYLGDTLQGEASRVEPGNPAFGRIHREVLGAWGGQDGNGAGRRGIANAYGARGVSAQCEYVLTGASQGTGACLFSDGARYQLHFG